MLLAALGLEAWPSLLEELEALGPKAIACFKTDTGYELVSAPSGANKKWQARTSGKPCGQRGLGSFTSAEAAAIEVFRWIVGIKPTPPTPGRLKSRSKRGEGKRQLDRCNHGRGALFYRSEPSRPPLTARSHAHRWPGPTHQRAPAEQGEAGAGVDGPPRPQAAAPPLRRVQPLELAGRGGARDAGVRPRPAAVPARAGGPACAGLVIGERTRDGRTRTAQSGGHDKGGKCALSLFFTTPERK